MQRLERSLWAAHLALPIRQNRALMDADADSAEQHARVIQGDGRPKEGLIGVLCRRHALSFQDNQSSVFVEKDMADD
jgi:hypothetical protein